MACQYNKHIQCLYVQGWAKIVHQELPIASHTISIALDLQMYIVHISILYIYVQPSCPCGEIMIPISRSPPSKSPSRRLSKLSVEGQLTAGCSIQHLFASMVHREDLPIANFELNKLSSKPIPADQKSY